jgi:hypothetical protein
MTNPINPKPALAGKSSRRADKAHKGPASDAILTPEEIAVLTGRDETHENDVLSLLKDEGDRLACTFDDPGSIMGGFGIDVIETESGDDRLFGNHDSQIGDGAARDGLASTSGGAGRDMGCEPSAGIDIINLSAEADEWVMITGHEADDAVAITRK